MFADRVEAARQLAVVLSQRDVKQPVVLALPRGGVVLGAVLAAELSAPLGLVLVRKIGHPYSPEYAVGAVAEDEPPLLNEAEAAALDPQWLKTATSQARQLIKQRRQRYYGGDTPTPITGKTAIVVDDGIATGLTMMAAVRSLKRRGANRIIVAVPVAPADSIKAVQSLADEVIVLLPPSRFLGAVGNHYRDFPQVEDAEVKRLLKAANRLKKEKT